LRPVLLAVGDDGAQQDHQLAAAVAAGVLLEQAANERQVTQGTRLRPIIADSEADWSQQIDDAAQRIEQRTGGGAGDGEEQ